MRYDSGMSKKAFVSLMAVMAIAGAGYAVAQQKPVSSRTTITVYKTPT
jgi:uncharacterized protein YfiM (DUF2279 family)